MVSYFTFYHFKMVFRNKEKEIMLVVSWEWILRKNIAFVSLNLWPESLLRGRNELCEKMAQYLRKSRKKKWKVKLQKDNRKKFSSRTTIQKQNILETNDQASAEHITTPPGKIL